MIKIMLDSASDQGQALRETYKLVNIPMSITVGKKEFIDDNDNNFKVETLHQYMREGKQPHTAQISPQVAMETFEAAAKAGDDVIFISISIRLSSSIQVAKNAMEEVKDRYPNFKGAVVDCRSASGAGTLLFLHGQALVEAGYNFDQVEVQLQKSAQEIAVFVAVDDIDWLIKGGRVSKTVGRVGSLLRVKPLISIDDTGFIRDSIVRGRDRVYTKMVDRLIDHIASPYEGQYIVVSHVGRPDMAERVKNYIIDQFGPVNIGVFAASPVIASHIGLGGMAVFGYEKKPELFEPVAFKS